MTKLRLKIRHDDDAPDVRKDYDHVGTMVCWHRRYDLGDEKPREDPQEWREAFDTEHPDAIILPLWLYEHGGITISVANSGDRWDSGQVGWIYVTLDKARRELCNADDTDDQAREKAEACLRAEVTEYAAYLTGDCWGFQLYEVATCNLGHEHETPTDSCWGFVGSDSAKEGILDHLPEEARTLFEAAWDDRQ